MKGRHRAAVTFVFAVNGAAAARIGSAPLTVAGGLAYAAAVSTTG